MHKRSLGLSLFGGLAIIVAACGGGATPSPSTAVPPSSAPSEAASPSSAASPSEAASASAVAQANLKIGVVTDIGTLNDKGYNEYSFKGAVDGAAAIGSAAPQSTVPTSRHSSIRSTTSS
jgi:basic membrane lipoprotein Med (substrate-binding protein (PBP1-ABC) superfamily)